MLYYFVIKKMPDIRVPIRIFTDGMGDQANPDGQTLAGTTMYNWTLSDVLLDYYKSGRLISHHAMNLHWNGMTSSTQRPPYAHCVPLGLENRDCQPNVENYVYMMEKYVLGKHIVPHTARDMLLSSFSIGDRKPDRFKAIRGTGIQPKLFSSKREWLVAITK